MITDKQIEEATRNYSKALDEEQILSFAWRDFKAGAHWAINEFLEDLWHEASEEPKKDKYVLVEYNYKTVTDYLVVILSTKISVATWKDHLLFKATRWLYIDDLLPKEGGEG